MRKSLRFAFYGLPVASVFLCGWFMPREGSAPLLSGTQSTAAAAAFLTEDACRGDGNGDGVRDVRDVVLIMAHILKKISLDGEALDNADANQDLSVDVLDIVDLLRHELGQTSLADCQPVFPSSAPSIKNIVPGAGPPGSTFTLLGRGFSPVSSQNTVVFFGLNEEFPVDVTGASPHLIFGKIPQSIQHRVFGVRVRVGGEESNNVAFQVRAGPVDLEVKPERTSLLLPPGSGTATVVIGGGTPPYHFDPLEPFELNSVQPVLKGTTIELEGIARGNVRLDVTDSSQPPQTTPAFVEVLEPRFFPTLNIVPHTLLAGASPGYTLLLRHGSDDMSPSRIELTFNGHSVDFSRLSPGSVLALGTQVLFSSVLQDFEAFFVSEDSSSEQVLFSGRSRLDAGTIEFATGFFTADPPVLVLQADPEPLPATVMPATITQDILIDHGILQLPEDAGELFEVTASFRSVTTVEGEDLPLLFVHSAFRATVGLTPGAPRIERLQPALGGAGQIVQIQGSGFDADPAGNQVSFQGADDERVPVTVLSASEDELEVRVPQAAVTGPLRVQVVGMTSNDYQFFVRFRPDAVVLFENFEAGEPTAPVLSVSQFFSPDRLERILGQDLAFDSMGVCISGGQIKTDTLEPGETVGSAVQVPFSSGNEQTYFVLYAGQETEGAQRHIFELKLNPAPGTPNGTLWMWEQDGEVRFELALGFIFILGDTLTIEFDEDIYIPPADPGTIVATRAEVRSIPWNYFGEQMVVVFPGEVETQ